MPNDLLEIGQLIGESPCFLAEVRKLPRVAQCDASVLIAGETGTGKELCAKAIHSLSPRSGGCFTPLNCGAVPVDLLENELFGHERGAFTGAALARTGLIHETQGGTLFLDEIDCLPSAAQVKLLRLLQEKEYRPLGSGKMRQADIRVIAATNVDLQEALNQGRLRRDLYYRLNIFSLTLPPLRERLQDIPLLARHFLAKYSTRFCKSVKDFAVDAMKKLLLHPWPGNVRELEHVVERATALTNEPVIQAADIDLPHTTDGHVPESFQEAKARMIAQFERTYVQGLLLTHQGNITRAAEAAQKNRRAFWELIRKHRIDAHSFRCVPQVNQGIHAPSPGQNYPGNFPRGNVAR